VRLAIITSRYWPESSPGAKRAYALAAALRSAGHAVTVLTQVPNYPDPAAFAYELGRNRTTRVEEDPAGNTTWRFVPRIASRDDLAGRLVGEARFAFLTSRMRQRLSNLDGVIASTPFVFNLLAARSFRVPMWLDLRDLTWEYAHALGRRSWLRRTGAQSLRWLALSSFRAAQGISTTSAAQRRYLVDRGIPAGKIHLVPNGVPREIFEDLKRRSAASSTVTERPLRLVYAGLLGYPQGLGFAVDAVEGMDGDGVELHLFGEGVDRAALGERCRESSLGRIGVHGHVPYETYLDTIASADVLLVSLRPEVESAMPSKLLEYMAAGRPILFVGSGEGAETVREAEAGLVVPYGDMRGFQEAVRSLTSDPAARCQMGSNGRRWIDRHRIQEEINGTWVRTIEDALLGTRAPGES
jgi:colanic acid biosynthesis glycosyl transferase WcaI